MSNNTKEKDTPKSKIQPTLFGINNHDITQKISIGMAKTLEKLIMSLSGKTLIRKSLREESSNMYVYAPEVSSNPKVLDPTNLPVKQQRHKSQNKKRRMQWWLRRLTTQQYFPGTEILLKGRIRWYQIPGNQRIRAVHMSVIELKQNLMAGRPTEDVRGARISILRKMLSVFMKWPRKIIRD